MNSWSRPSRTRASLSLLALAGVAVTAACESTPDAVVVARAADHELTVDETVRLLAGATQVPNDPRVVLTLADLWVDYTLLAEAMAEDSTLSHLDLGPLISQRIEAEAIAGLADSVVRPDTAISESELESLYASEGAGVEARARHILIAFPPNPTDAQIDSVRQITEDLRQRVMAGEDFAALAEEHSQDPGSAVQGGDLGWFPRGQMVRSFDDAVFALEPGEVGEVVQTPYGFHVVRLDERRVPAFEDVRDDFRQMMLNRRLQAAESTYIAGLMDGAAVEVVENGAELTRQMARNPRTRLSGRAERRTVATYQGGEVTVGEVRDFMLTRQPQFRAQVEAATDEIIEEALIEDMVRRELLLARAIEAGHEPTTETVDSLGEFARQQFVEAARVLGLGPVAAQPGENRTEAVERTVTRVLEQILGGARQATPLGAIGFILRKQYDGEVFEEPAVPLVVERVANARGPGAGAGAPGQGVAPPVPGGTPTAPAPGAGQPGGGAAPSDTASATGGGSGG